MTTEHKPTSGVDDVAEQSSSKSPTASGANRSAPEPQDSPHEKPVDEEKVLQAWFAAIASLRYAVNSMLIRTQEKP